MKKLFVIFAAAAMLILGTGCERIDTGNVGIKITQGQVSDKELLPDPWGYLTLFTRIIEASGKEVTMQLNDVKAKSKDNITMADLDVDVIYKINPEKAADIFIKYRGDLVDDSSGDAKLVGFNFASRQVREAVYQAAAQINAGDMHTKRDELSGDIMKRAQHELDSTAGDGWFQVTGVNIRSVVADTSLENSIREAAKVQFQVKAKLQERDLAQAEADRKQVEAQGEARANKIISESLTPQLVQLKIKEMELQAALAIASKQGNTVLMSGDATPLVSVR